MQFLYSIFVLQVLKYQQKMSLPPSVFPRHRAESNAEITKLLRLYLLHVLVRHTYRVPREMVDDLSLETFWVRLDGVLSNLLWLKMPLLIAGRLNEMSFGSSFQPKLFYDSMIPQFCDAVTDVPPCSFLVNGEVIL